MDEEFLKREKRKKIQERERERVKQNRESIASLFSLSIDPCLGRASSIEIILLANARGPLIFPSLLRKGGLVKEACGRLTGTTLLF